MLRLFPRSGLVLLALAAVASASGCATVGSPSGGPADQTPPSFVAASPADGATNVSETTLRLAFSERLAAGSAARAVRVVPEGASPPRVRVRGDEIEIRFDSLRAATTYVVTVGSELTDERNVKLTSPVTVAFATGDQIDRGEITGVVRDPQTGRGASGLSVLAYANRQVNGVSSAPDLSTAADYRTEVGSDGRFRLAYLRPDTFTVFALEDRNRNGLADAGERYAVPSQRVTLAVSPDDSTAQISDLDLWVTALDTIPPQPRRVRPISNQRFAVRFDDAVQILTRSPDAWVLADSASATSTLVTPYMDPVQPAEIRFETAQPLPSTPHRLQLVAPGAVADSSGVHVQPFSLTFTPPDRPDTTQARFVGFLPGSPTAPDSTVALRPDQSVVLRFTSPPAPTTLTDRIELVGPDGDVDSVNVLPRLDGLTVELIPEGEASTWPPEFSLRLRQPDSTFTGRYLSRGPDDLGGLTGQVPLAANRPVRLEATLDDGTVLSVPVDADGRFEILELAPGTVRLRLFEDVNGDGRWNGGQLPPQGAAPEPLLLVPEPLQIRARWDTEVAPASLALFSDPP